MSSILLRVRSRLAVACAAVAVCLVSAVQSFAQQTDAALNTEDGIARAFEETGIDPETLMSGYAATIGPVYLQALTIGFVFTIGWVVYKHFRKGVSSM